MSRSRTFAASVAPPVTGSPSIEIDYSFPTRTCVPRAAYSSVVRLTGIMQQEISPVVYTCGVSVLQDLRRTKAVLGGL